jgi:hypothetical protein
MARYCGRGLNYDLAIRGRLLCETEYNLYWLDLLWCHSTLISNVVSLDPSSHYLLVPRYMAH